MECTAVICFNIPCQHRCYRPNRYQLTSHIIGESCRSHITRESWAPHINTGKLGSSHYKGKLGSLHYTGKLGSFSHYTGKLGSFSYYTGTLGFSHYTKTLQLFLTLHGNTAALTHITWIRDKIDSNFVHTLIIEISL